MELESLFSSPRWKILDILARNPSSPLEISKIISTSVAYVSQQLKLLEAANLIRKERTRAAEKGKARSLYSLTSELVHFTALLKNNPIRKSLKLSEHQKTILKIWLLADEKYSLILEKLFWTIESEIGEIKSILLEDNIHKFNVIIFSDSKKVKTLAEQFRKNNPIVIEVIGSESQKRIPTGKFNAIYDPLFIFKGNENLKGGNV